MSEKTTVQRLRDYRERMLAAAEAGDPGGMPYADFGGQLKDLSEAILYAAQDELATTPVPIVQFDEASVIQSGSDLAMLQQILATSSSDPGPLLDRIEAALAQVMQAAPEQPQG